MIVAKDVVLTQNSIWTEDHMYMLTYSLVILIFYPLFGCPTTHIGSLSKGQPHSCDVNHSVFISFWLKGHWEPPNNGVLKTWDGHKKVKI